MADVLELDQRGRARCRGCGQALLKGQLRFGEALPNPFGEGETHRWFHLVCAACMRPQALLPALDAYAAEVPEREWLRAAALTGVEHRRLPRLLRAERASSGRARCRQCREMIAKGELRFALQMFEDENVRPNPIGFIHATCSEPYFGTRDLLERALRLTPELSGEDRDELERLLALPPAEAAEAAQAAPALAKTRPPGEPGSSAQSA